MYIIQSVNPFLYYCNALVPTRVRIKVRGVYYHMHMQLYKTRTSILLDHYSITFTRTHRDYSRSRFTS